MDVDWEVEIGAGAPVIEASWPGFIDLRNQPARIGEIAEAAAFSPLARLIAAVNAPDSRFWTSKCDLWQPEPAALACYVDVLPREGLVFAEWKKAEEWCRACVAKMQSTELAETSSGGCVDSIVEDGPEITIALVIREANVGETEGFGVTAYLSAKDGAAADAAEGLAHAMDILADAVLCNAPAPGGIRL
jgi:hypothetical protein